MIRERQRAGMWSFYSCLGPCVRELRRSMFDEDTGERQASIELKYVKTNWINNGNNQAKGFLNLAGKKILRLEKV